MSLKAKVEENLKQAMRNKDQDSLRALRAIKSLILIEETKENGAGTLTEDEETKLLVKASKQRKDSIDIFKKQGREDLAEKEIAELRIIEQYLPRQLEGQELEDEVKKIISQTGAAGPKDMGKVMGAANKELAGKVDGRMLSEVVKKLLG